MPQVNLYSKSTRLIASGQVSDEPYFLMSITIGHDTVNDPVVAVHNDTDGDDATKEVIPSNTYDYGIAGVVLNYSKWLDTACYVKISSLGSGSVIVDGRKASELGPYDIR